VSEQTRTSRSLSGREILGLDPLPDLPHEQPHTPQPRTVKSKKLASRFARRGDPIFDLVAMWTNTHPTKRREEVSRLCWILAKAEPPYTFEEVQRIFDQSRELIPQKDCRLPTLNEVEVNIAKVRDPQPHGLPV
jgi:hypothetical protein